MFLVLKHYVTIQAKLNARNVTTSESLSIRTITILVGIFNIICGFLQLYGHPGEKEVGSRERFQLLCFFFLTPIDSRNLYIKLWRDNYYMR